MCLVGGRSSSRSIRTFRMGTDPCFKQCQFVPPCFFFAQFPPPPSYRDFVYGYLADSGGTSGSPGVPLSCNCITNTSDSHTINLLEIGLSTTKGYKSSDVDISSYTARSRYLGGNSDMVNASIAMPFVHLSMEIKQGANS
ncbi:unnamed protein product [Ectocarpus sp. 13 AM-2016]